MRHEKCKYWESIIEKRVETSQIGEFIQMKKFVFKNEFTQVSGQT